MKTLIVYDSAFGNTAKIAAAIKDAISRKSAVELLLVGNFRNSSLKSVNLLIVGSPTQGGRATQAIQDCIARLPDLQALPFATFDSRFDESEQRFGLRILMKVIGFAAEKIALSLKRKGGVMVEAPAGFLVGAKEGPLREGELERAARWARDALQEAME
jgi:flavodoxin